MEWVGWLLSSNFSRLCSATNRRRHGNLCLGCSILNFRVPWKDCVRLRDTSQYRLQSLKMWSSCCEFVNVSVLSWNASEFAPVQRTFVSDDESAAPSITDVCWLITILALRPDRYRQAAVQFAGRRLSRLAAGGLETVEAGLDSVTKDARTVYDGFVVLQSSTRVAAARLAVNAIRQLAQVRDPILKSDVLCVSVV